MATEDAPPSPDEPSDVDDRIAIEVGRGVEWLCEPEVVGWRSTAGGHDGLIGYVVLPP